MHAERQSNGQVSSRSQPARQNPASPPIQRARASVGPDRSKQARPQPHSFGAMGIRVAEASSADSGRPLPETLRGKMETALRADFSDVRIHEDATADKIDALAYTRGKHIHFAPGTFQPNSPASQEIIGHELTHVVQQRQGQVNLPADGTGAIDEDPRLEREAETLGQQAAQGQVGARPSTVATGGPGLAASAGAGGAVQRAPNKRKRSNSSSSSDESDSSSSDESESSSSDESEAERSVGVKRLQRSWQRNQRKKAKPVNGRTNYEAQRRHNYGYKHPNIDEGLVKASFRPGFGGQPFLSINKENYDDAVVGTNYDELVKDLPSGDEEKDAASDILKTITDDDDLDKGKYSAKQRRSAATLSGLTQFIEPHGTRIPSADKWARASLRRIAAKDSTFKKEFNRKNGNYLPARAKSGGSSYGGQEAARALLGAPKPSHKATHGDVYDSEVEKTLSYLSSSSQEELSDSSEEESASSSEEESEEKKPPKKKQRK